MDRQVTFLGKNNQVWSEQAHAHSWYQRTNWYKRWSCIMHMCRLSCMYQSFRPYPLNFWRDNTENWPYLLCTCQWRTPIPQCQILPKGNLLSGTRKPLPHLSYSIFLSILLGIQFIFKWIKFTNSVTIVSITRCDVCYFVNQVSYKKYK